MLRAVQKSRVAFRVQFRRKKTSRLKKLVNRWKEHPGRIAARAPLRLGNNRRTLSATAVGVVSGLKCLKRYAFRARVCEEATAALWAKSAFGAPTAAVATAGDDDDVEVRPPAAQEASFCTD